MIKTLKILIATLLTGAVLLGPAVATVSAAGDIQNNLCSGVGLSVGSPTNCATDSTNATGSVNNIITTVINVFSAIVGAISVIMIIVGGFRYITSGGDSGKVSSAQQTIVYAIVGLVIVALAQVIVRFVLARTLTPQ